MIEYKTGFEGIDWNSLIDMYKEVDLVIGLARAGKVEKIKKSFKNTYKIITAWDDDQIVGAGRLLSDGECYGWIHDVGVHPNYQKRGIGRGIMNELMRGNEHLLIGLTSSFEAVEFYKKLDFKKHKTAMAKYPGESTYLED
ncbi:MAG: GNAT family N-acetyltransferase [Chloroflexi bacterium]|nr:GNAT family N-acetyltransferase [Chloroflexota bacterium]MBT3668824.1 GNAT family N-acetyltransferase [Chloroflexota bacterium]MBT4003795.1 GNAT family N-acetyltransferase [Chloroflexota bacterium]MBT4306538.1 GNAT family N-acetyltransferase [Chloroflexota bacterium]MBT4533922.1 GNAT family N-acetyltransferase [Chloroflexota bacterium]